MSDLRRGPDHAERAHAYRASVRPGLVLSPRLRWALAATLLAAGAVSMLDEPAADASDLAVPTRGSAATANAVQVSSTPVAATAAGSLWPPGPRARPATGAAPVGPAMAAWGEGRRLREPSTPPPEAIVQPVTESPPAPTVSRPTAVLLGVVGTGGDPPRALLADASRTLVLGAGDRVDTSWRVERVTSSALVLISIDGAERHTLTLTTP